MSQKDRLLSRARRKGGLSVSNFTPATGIGKFDARYDPFTNALHITLKVFYVWRNLPGRPPWTAPEQQEFKQAYKDVVENTWSECYTIASDRPEWREMYARVFVHVEEVDSQPAAHYTLSIGNFAKGDTSSAGIDRAGMTGLFGQWDVFPEEKLKRDRGALEFKMRQIGDRIESSGARYLAFPANSSALPTEALVALSAFANAARGVINQEMAESEFAIYVYGSVGAVQSAIRNLMTGKNRARAVVDFLGQKLGFPKCVKVVESSQKEPWIVRPVGDVLRAQGLAPADVNARKFPGVILLTKDPGPAGTGLTKGMQRNYVIVAHETGHMFGLPDEYFGVNCLNLEQQIDLLTTVPAAIKNLTRVKPDPYEPGQAEGFAALARASNVPVPVFMNTKETVTTSIMYAGSDVLPAHYLNFWQALLFATVPYFNPDQWKIVPNAAGQGKKSNLAFFAR